MRRACLSFFPVLLSSLLSSFAGNWPQAGGPNGNFIVPNAKAPTEWSVTLDQNIAWKTTLPELGQSSVTVWGDRVYFSINKPVEEDTVLAKDIRGLLLQARSMDPSFGGERFRVSTH